MGGREGLVDTAVKTAETGYMQRRLVKVNIYLFLKRRTLHDIYTHSFFLILFSSVFGRSCCTL